MTKLEWLQKGNRQAKVITRQLRQDLVSDPSMGTVGPYARYSEACSQYKICILRRCVMLFISLFHVQTENPTKLEA